MKHGLMLITFFMILTACSSVDVSPGKEDAKNDLSPQTITLEQTDYISESEIIESDQDIKLVNSETKNTVEPQSYLLNASQTAEEKQNDSTYFSQEPLEQPAEMEETPVEDTIIIGDTEYISLMQDEKFQDWTSVAEKYGATLYAIPYSDVFAIVKDKEVIVGMSTGVATAAPNHLDILCDLMADKGEAAQEIIDGIKNVAKSGESVQVIGPQEFGDDFSIDMQDEWIVVSW